MCSLACKIKKNQRKTARKEKNWRKNEKDITYVESAIFYYRGL